MSTQQMVDRGKKEMKEVDTALKRSEKVVEDTITIATTTAETLHKQTEQLERTLDGLDEVHFTLQKAKQVIRDITRGIATDKCVAAGDPPDICRWHDALEPVQQLSRHQSCSLPCARAAGAS